MVGDSLLDNSYQNDLQVPVYLQDEANYFDPDLVKFIGELSSDSGDQQEFTDQDIANLIEMD